MKKKIIAAFLTAAMTIGSLSGVTVFAADAGTDEKRGDGRCFRCRRNNHYFSGIPWVVSMARRLIHW